MSQAKLLLIYIDETDQFGHVPLYEAIVRMLQANKLAGATVQTGLMGFGAHGFIHRKRLFGISDDKPVSIIAVDREDKIRAVLPELQSMIKEGLIALVDTEVIPLTAQQ